MKYPWHENLHIVTKQFWKICGGCGGKKISVFWQLWQYFISWRIEKIFFWFSLLTTLLYFLMFQWRQMSFETFNVIFMKRKDVNNRLKNSMRWDLFSRRHFASLFWWVMFKIGWKFQSFTWVKYPENFQVFYLFKSCSKSLHKKISWKLLNFLVP